MSARPQTTSDLRPTERRFVSALQQLRYGRVEGVKIHHGELILNPWPTTVRTVKLGVLRAPEGNSRPAEFDLTKQHSDFFEHVRAIEEGEIRVLEVQDGLPHLMQLEDRLALSGGANG